MSAQQKARSESISVVSRPGFELEPHGMVWDNAKYDSLSGVVVGFAWAGRGLRSGAIVTLGEVP